MFNSNLFQWRTWMSQNCLHDDHGWLNNSRKWSSSKASNWFQNVAFATQRRFCSTRFLHVLIHRNNVRNQILLCMPKSWTLGHSNSASFFEIQLSNKWKLIELDRLLLFCHYEKLHCLLIENRINMESVYWTSIISYNVECYLNERVYMWIMHAFFLNQNELRLY